jgi:SAM-dependent methyltransferase
MTAQLSLFNRLGGAGGLKPISDELREFREYGRATVVRSVDTAGCSIPVYVNEFWTAKQRAAHSLHEISYRACFKPQLPRFFVERFTTEGDRVYDPFLGRGTTALEAALLGRRVAGCDVNPLSRILLQPRLNPPSLNAVASRLREINLEHTDEYPADLETFYHPETLAEICSLKNYLILRQTERSLDSIDEWIRMVAVNRLTGHSPGFFSVYTLPPNQAVSLKAQQRINLRRKQVPPRRSVPDLILRKSQDLLTDCEPSTLRRLRHLAPDAWLLTTNAETTPQIPRDSITLIVTSPPFLDVVDYVSDNWLRCWFCGIDRKNLAISVTKSVDEWQRMMLKVFRELYRVLKAGGHVAFEVGEVRGGRVQLEDYVIPAGADAGFLPELVLINDQRFTKTANCWGVTNEQKGTNTNRVVLFRKLD